MTLNRINVWPGIIYGDSFDQIFYQGVRGINQEPQFICSPRGSKVKEVLATTLVLGNPRARLLNSKARDTQYGFAVGEFLWYWAGKNDLETMLYYNKRMKDFSNDGVSLNSAYGARLKTQFPFAGGPGVANPQWETCKNTLLKDPDSRRALMLINDPYDQWIADNWGSKDVPCTLSLQFFIRENELHLHVHMRSNDVVWGLTYDLFSFTLMQELMMFELQAAGMKDLRLGGYYHTAGSLHIYERHFEMAQRVVSEYVLERPADAAPMEPLVLDEMGRLLEFEEMLRTGNKPNYGSDSFSGGNRWMAEQLEAHRRKRDSERR